jgi:hypothetical protein
VSTPDLAFNGDKMIRGFLDALAGFVQHACQAERHVTFFAFDDDVDQPDADMLSPAQVRASLAGTGIETKGGRLFDLQICCCLLAVPCALNLIFNVLPLVE